MRTGYAHIRGNGRGRVFGARLVALLAALVLAFAACPAAAHAEAAEEGEDVGALRAAQFPSEWHHAAEPEGVGASEASEAAESGASAASGSSKASSGKDGAKRASGRSASSAAASAQDVSGAGASDASIAEAPAQTNPFGLTGVVFPFIPNPTTDEFIASIAEDSREIGHERDLYASVMIAQAVLESGSGSSGLSKPPYNNLFGIKGAYHGKSVGMLTSEDDGTGKEYDIIAGFRWYPSAKASLEDYADLLTVDMAGFYAPAWKSNAKTYVEACDYLQGRYATDTLYSGKLRGIIEAYALEQYDRPKAKVKAKTKLPYTTPSHRAAPMSDAQLDAVSNMVAAELDAATARRSVARASDGADDKRPERPLEDRGVQGAIAFTGLLAAFFAKNEIAALFSFLKGL